MTTLQRIADTAVRRLAREICCHGDIMANWRVIDRVERRFKLVGLADHFIDSFRAEIERENERRLLSPIPEDY